MKQIVCTKLAFLICLYGLAFGLNTEQPNNKYVIGCHLCGFFANFVAVINKLDMCEKNDLTPVIYWDSMSLYYQKKGFNGSLNVWEYFFEPSSTLKYTHGDPIDRRTSSVLPFLINPGNLMPTKHERIRAHELISKYMPLKPLVISTINEFRRDNMARDHIIGIHLRGTDKKDEVTPVPPQKIFDAANAYASSCKQPVKFFVASDEAVLIEMAKKCLHGPVITYNAQRSLDGKPIHLSKRQEPALAGLDILVEVILLASCDIVFHTICNVAKGILMFNPYLENVCLKA